MYEPFLGVNPWTALFVLLNTLTLFFVAGKYLYEPVTDIIGRRQQEIDTLYKEAQAAREEALTLQARYQERLAAVRQESEQILKDAAAQGHRREEAILARATQEAQAIRQGAMEDIAREKKKALNEAKTQIAFLAVAIAEKVVARELTPGDQRRLGEEFLRELRDGL